MSTAQFREQARAAEKACEWEQAAYLWACAIEAYPAAQKGALAEADVAAMTKRRDSCRRQCDVSPDPENHHYVGHPMHY